MKLENFKLVTLLVCTFFITSYANADLFAYWPLDKIVDGKVIDQSGNGYDGTVIGNLKPIQDANHKSLYFDGKASYIDCGSEGFDKINDQITITAWIKIDKFDKWIQTIVAKDGNIWQLQRGWGDHYHSVNFNLHVEKKMPVCWGGVMGVKDVDDNDWHHLAGTYDGQTLRLYIDGELSSSKPTRNRKLSDLKNTLTIGENLLNGNSNKIPKFSRSWHGNISQVAIFDHALTHSQIGLLYHTDPGICQQFAEFSDVISREDIALIKNKNIPEKLFKEFLKCKRLAQQRKYTKAIKEIDVLIKANDKADESLIASLYLLKNQIYLQLNDIKKAVKALDSLQKKCPTIKSPKAMFQRAYCNIKQKNHTKAQNLLLQVITDYPNSAYASQARICLKKMEQK